jgi:lipopolysaccharide export LptBFGC system permease protein LptF
MVLLAAILAIKTSIKIKNFYYIFISILTCVVIYYLKDLSLAIGLAGKISLVLSVWMPIILISIFCTIGVMQINEK